MELCASLQKIGSITFSILLLYTVRIEGGVSFLSVEERCIPTCTFLNNIPNWTFLCDGDRSTCAWQCAAQRMGCDEGLTYHCAQYYENYELKRNKIEYIEACAPERFCNAGEEPYVTFSFDDVVRSPRNAKINCVPCANPNFYNSQAGKSSASYSRCYQQKFNKCIPEDHKINSGEISWRNQKETDGYCRCDARNGYAPENENVKTRCFYSDEFCAHKTCPQPSQALLLNYTCGDKCPSGMHRTEYSDECVPKKLDQTTKRTPTIRTSQNSDGESTTTETIKVFSTTKGVEGKGNSDGFNEAIFILTIIAGFIVVLLLLIIVIFISGAHIIHQTINKMLNQMAGDKFNVQKEEPLHSDARSKGIEISLFQQVHDPTDTSSLEFEETSFNTLPDHIILGNGHIEDQSVSETPLLSGYKEKTDRTPIVSIKARDVNADINTGPCPTTSGNADGNTSKDWELCHCDKPDGLCSENLQLIAQKCGAISSFRADLELSKKGVPVHALQEWRAKITSENRNKHYKKLIDAVLVTGQTELYTELKAKLFSHESELPSPVSERKNTAKLSGGVKPVYPPSTYTPEATLYLDRDGTTAKELVENINGQETVSSKSEDDETNEERHRNEKYQVIFDQKSTDAAKMYTDCKNGRVGAYSVGRVG